MIKSFRKGSSGFISISILLVIGVLSIGSIGLISFEYQEISSKINESRQFLATENYEDAKDVLEDVQENWLVASFGVKSDEIDNELQEIEVRQAHKEIYDESFNFLREGKWEEGLAGLFKIPEDSFYYQQAQARIEEAEQIIRGAVQEVITEQLEETRNEANDFSVKIAIGQARSVAEIHFSREGAYTGVDLSSLKERVREAGSTLISHIGESRYCAYAALPQEGGWQCTESTGVLVHTTTDPGGRGFCDGITYSCPTDSQ